MLVQALHAVSLAYLKSVIFYSDKAGELNIFNFIKYFFQVKTIIID